MAQESSLYLCPDRCGSATSLSDTVTKNTFPQVSLGPDTGICAGDSIQLNAGTDGTSYQWSNGGSTSQLYTYTTAEYYVSVTKNGCTTVDSVHVSFDVVPAAIFTASNGILTAYCRYCLSVEKEWRHHTGSHLTGVQC
jgi:hypothetical protein